MSRILVAVALLISSEACAHGPGSTTESAEWAFCRQGRPAAGGRLLVSDKIVCDQSSHLIWERSPAPVKYRWEDAKSHCEGLTVTVPQKSFTGWRLASKDEILSLLRKTPNQVGEWTDAGAFPDSLLYRQFWTSTKAPMVSIRTAMWLVDVRSESPAPQNAASDYQSGAWCVYDTN